MRNREIIPTILQQYERQENKRFINEVSLFK